MKGKCQKIYQTYELLSTEELANKFLWDTTEGYDSDRFFKLQTNVFICNDSYTFPR